MAELEGRQKLSGRVAGEIIGHIEANGLMPGNALPSEVTLGEHLNVSRAVVREALKVLEGRGVIEIVGGRGAVIRSADAEVLKAFFDHALRTSSDSIIELMEVRHGIETFGARLAAQRRTAVESRAIGRIAEEMNEALEDHERFADLDVAFHLAIANAARNSLQSALMVSIRESMRDSVLAGLRRRQNAGQINQVQILHLAIAHAIQAGDPEGAALAMSNHFSEAVEALVQ